MSNYNLRNYKVYIHWIPANKTKYKYRKYYIGITNRKNINDRWGKDGCGYKGQPFYRAIQKYGWNNFHHNIIYQNLAYQEACSKEIELIAKYDSLLGHKGYNATTGEECIGVKNDKPVYCITTKQAFKNSTIASYIVGENASTIYNKCRRFSEYNFNVRGGYLWCFIDDMYYAFNKYNTKDKIVARGNSKSKPIIHIGSKIIYPNSNYAHRVLNIPLYTRYILNKDKFLWYSNRNKNVDDKFMFLVDYLSLYDCS